MRKHQLDDDEWGTQRIVGSGVYGTVAGAHEAMAGTIGLIHSIGRIEYEFWIRLSKGACEAE